MIIDEIGQASAEELVQRKAAIVAEVAAEGADLNALEEEMRTIVEELEIRKNAEEQRQAILASVASGNANPVEEMNTNERGSAMNEREQRAQALVESGRVAFGTEEVRSTLVSGGTIATPTQVSGINDMIGGVNTSLLDMIYVENCEGMSAHKVAYVADETGAAADQTEGNAATAKDATFGYTTIEPTSIAVTSQISKQVKKQSPLQYEAKVNALAYKSLRKAAKAKVVAAMKADAVKVGTLCTVKNAAVSSKKGVIGATTLRDIVFAFGGDEEIPGGAVLFLNKADLLAFGDVRGTNEKKAVYEITPDGTNPATGVIKDGGLSVRYCIESGLTACAGTTQSATAATPTMFYGDPKAVELDLFSDYAIRVSEDFAITSLMDTIVGDVEVGAGLVKKNGLVCWMLAKDE